MALSLVDTADKFGQPEMKKAYWNTFHCQSKVYTAGSRVYGRYCKNRFCTVCCANRKADIINRYLPAISKWPNPYFVTITVKSVSLSSLKAVMKCMIKEFRAIVETYRKRNLRGKGPKLMGIRSLESNFNSRKKNYNPHFHCVVATKEMANILVSEWLKRSRPGKTNKKAQKLKPVNDNLKILIEVVKYGSKIFTEPDLKNKSKKTTQKADAVLYAAALNNIFHAMSGLRIFDRFGFNLPKDAKPLPAGARVVTEYREWHFHPVYYDWIDSENGHCLTAYQPPPHLVNLLANCIDVKLE